MKDCMPTPSKTDVRNILHSLKAEQAEAEAQLQLNSSVEQHQQRHRRFIQQK
jgi:hypothetical protein